MAVAVGALIPASPTAASSTPERSAANQTTCLSGTVSSMTVVIPGTATNDLSPGDTFSAHLSSGECVGYGTVPQSGTWTITVWGDELDLVDPNNEITGAEQGAPLVFKANFSEEVGVTTNQDEQVVKYVANRFVVLSLLVLTVIEAEQDLPYSITDTPYPNPATDYINVPYETGRRDVKLELLDMLGRTIDTYILPSRSSSTLQISLQGLSAGTYAIRTKSRGNRSRLYQFVKV